MNHDVVKGDTVPRYLSEVYSWAYLNRSAISLFDHPLAVSAILWGNSGRLMRWAIQEFKLGEKVLQAGCVYGNFSMMLAEQIGEQGSLDVLEAAPIQVANCRQKVEAAPQVKILQGDAASYDGQDYDRVCSFFLLHEIPADHRQKVIANLLSRVRPGGDVVFVDYHKPRRFHPLSLVMRAIFRLLEPFAQEFIENSLQGASPLADNFSWRKKTLFGGLYQKVVATRLR